MNRSKAKSRIAVALSVSGLVMTMGCAQAQQAMPVAQAVTQPAQFVDGSVPSNLTTPFSPSSVAPITDLTAAQVSAIETALSGFQSNAQPLVAAWRKDELSALGLIEAPNFDSTTAQTLAADESATAGKLITAALATRSSIYTSILSAAQQKAVMARTDTIAAGAQSTFSSQCSAAKFAQLTRQLGLSSDQTTEIASIVNAEQAAYTTSISSVNAVWSGYSSALPFGAYDATALNTALAKAEPIMTTLSVRDWLAESAIWKDLTAAQQTNLAGLFVSLEQGLPATSVSQQESSSAASTAAARQQDSSNVAPAQPGGSTPVGMD